MPVKEIRFDKQDVVKCDDRGRATLGTEFAGEQVFVYVAELPEPDELVEPSQAEKRVLSRMAAWADEHDVSVIDLHPETGEIEDKSNEVHQTPYRLGENNE